MTTDGAHFPPTPDPGTPEGWIAVKDGSEEDVFWDGQAWAKRRRYRFGSPFLVLPVNPGDAPAVVEAAEPAGPVAPSRPPVRDYSAGARSPAPPRAVVRQPAPLPESSATSRGNLSLAWIVAFGVWNALALFYVIKSIASHTLCQGAVSHVCYSLVVVTGSITGSLPGIQYVAAIGILIYGNLVILCVWLALQYSVKARVEPAVTEQAGGPTTRPATPARVVSSHVASSGTDGAALASIGFVIVIVFFLIRVHIWKIFTVGNYSLFKIIVGLVSAILWPVGLLAAGYGAAAILRIRRTHRGGGLLALIGLVVGLVTLLMALLSPPAFNPLGLAPLVGHTSLWHAVITRLMFPLLT